MRLTSVVTLSAALFLSSAAMAQDKKVAANEQPAANANYQAPADQAPAAQTPDEKKVCKSLPVSGTRMFKRACLTKQEWEKVEEDTH